MASNTSRILLTLSIPIGFFSIIWFFKKQNNKQFKKTIQIDNIQESYQILHPVKCNEQVENTCPKMRIKEGPAAEKQSKNGMKTYASKARGECCIMKQTICSSSDECKALNKGEDQLIVTNGMINHESSTENGVSCDVFHQNGVNISDIALNNTNNNVNGISTLNGIKNEINKYHKANSDILISKEAFNQDSVISKSDSHPKSSQDVLKTFDLIFHENGDIQNGEGKEGLNGFVNGKDIQTENHVIKLDSQLSSELNEVCSSKDVAGVSVNGQLIISNGVSSEGAGINGTQSEIEPSLPATNGAISKRTGNKKKKMKKEKRASKNLSEENNIHSQFHNLSIKSDLQPKNSYCAEDTVNCVEDTGSLTCNGGNSPKPQYHENWTATKLIPEYPLHIAAPVEVLPESDVVANGIDPVGSMLSTIPESFIPVNYVNVAASSVATYYENSEASNGLESPTETVPSADNEYLMVYEFEILPEDCGRLIGKNGKHVKQVMNETGTLVVIRKNPFCREKKICAVHGMETQINDALEMIRKRFPIEHFPHVTLVQINCIPVAFQCPESLKLQCPEGIAFEILLSSIVHAGHFFFQQPTHPSYFRLQHMQQTMTEDYNYSDAPMITNISAGNVCAAQLGNDWYRAEVIETFAEIEQCRLRFLDYGGYACVSMRAIRQIKCDYMTIPFQATECLLAGVMPVEGDVYSTEARAGLEKLCQGKILQGVIVGYSDTRLPLINLYYIVGTQVIYINQEMINLNCVRAISGSEEIKEVSEEYVDVNVKAER